MANVLTSKNFWSLVDLQRVSAPVVLRGTHIDLMMPSGSTVRMTSNEDLRKQLDRLGIPGVHTNVRFTPKSGHRSVGL